MNQKGKKIIPKATHELKIKAGFNFQNENLPKINQIPVPQGAEGCLLGINFVVTGRLPSLTSNHLKELIEKYGGNVASNISEKTDVVILGCEEVDPKIIQEAQNRSIQITDQDGIISFISKSNSLNVTTNTTQIYQPNCQAQQNICNLFPQAQNINSNCYNQQLLPLKPENFLNEEPPNIAHAIPIGQIQQQPQFNQYVPATGFNPYVPVQGPNQFLPTTGFNQYSSAAELNSYVPVQGPNQTVPSTGFNQFSPTAELNQCMSIQGPNQTVPSTVFNQFSPTAELNSYVPVQGPNQTVPSTGFNQFSPTAELNQCMPIQGPNQIVQNAGFNQFVPIQRPDQFVQNTSLYQYSSPAELNQCMPIQTSNQIVQSTVFNQFVPIQGTNQFVPAAGFNQFAPIQRFNFASLVPRQITHDRPEYPKPKLQEITYKRPLIKPSTTKLTNASLREYLSDKKKLHQQILDYIDHSDNLEEHFQSLSQTIQEQKIQEFKYKLFEMLNLISKIADNHKRCRDFFSKIEKLLLIFKNEFSKFFSNYDIFDIFKNNKRLLLFLIEERIIHFDDKIISVISTFQFSFQYFHYFQPEINQIIKMINIDPVPQDFNEKRRKEECDEYVCQLIINDSIEDFITHVKKTNLPLNSKIQKSIFETNVFLYLKEPTLIEYSAFFGSSQIFKYLFFNGVSLTQSLWLYAIHGDNAEIFSILKDNHIEPEDSTFEECYNEAVKCHHNHIVNYIEINFLKIDSNIKSDFLIQYLENYNFLLLNEDSINPNAFFYFCCYNYFYIVNELLQIGNVDVNSIHINRFVNDDLKGRYHERIETALNCAIYNGNNEIVKLLLEQKGIDINIPSVIRQSRSMSVQDVMHEDIKTALIFAIENENIEIIQLLLSFDDIDVNLQYENKELEFNDNLVDENTYGMVQGVNTFEQGTSLTRAIQKGNVEIVKLLLKHEKIDPNYLSLNIFDDCHYAGNDTFKRIEEPALNMAVSVGKEEIVKLLLNNKADPNIYTNKYLNYRNNFTDDEMEQNEYESILCYDADSDEIIKSRYTALNIAIENGNVGMVRLLLDSEKVDINKASISDRYIPQEVKTPLFFAVENDELEIVKLLLEQKNIDINFKCNWRTKEMTAIDIANEKGNPEIISLLYKKAS